MAQGFNSGGPSTEAGGIPGFSTSTGEGTERALSIQAKAMKESNSAFLQALDSTIKFADDQIRKSAEEEAKAGVESVQEDTRKAFFERELQTKAVESMPENTPQEIKDKEQEMARLKAAYDNGSLTSTHYWSRMDATARSLRARYPGYKDEIDSTVSKFAGGKPANQVIGDILSQIQAENNKKASDEWGELWKMGKHIPEVAMADAKGEKLSVLRMRQLVSQDAVRQNQIKTAEAELGLISSRVNLKEKINASEQRELTQSATTLANLETSNALNAFFAPLEPAFEQLKKAQEQGIPITAEQQGKLDLMLMNLEKQKAANIQAVLSRKRADGTSIIETVKDQAQLDSIRKGMEATYNLAFEAYKNKDGGMLGFLKRTNDYAAQGGEAAVRAHRITNLISGLKQAGIPEADISLAIGKDGKLRGQWEHLIKSLSLNIIGKTNTDPQSRTLGGFMASVANSESSAAVRAQALDEAISMFHAPKVSMGTKENFYNFLFGDNRQGTEVMALLRPGTEREEFFAKMVSPRGLEVIKKIEQDKPGTINKFRDWVENNGQIHFMAMANTINQYNDQNNSNKIVYSKEEQRFKIVANPAFKAGSNPTVPRDAGNAMGIVTSANKGIASLVPAIQTIYPKRDSTQELFNFVTRANVKLIDTPKQ